MWWQQKQKQFQFNRLVERDWTNSRLIQLVSSLLFRAVDYENYSASIRILSKMRCWCWRSLRFKIYLPNLTIIRTLTLIALTARKNNYTIYICCLIRCRYYFLYWLQTSQLLKLRYLFLLWWTHYWQKLCSFLRFSQSLEYLSETSLLELAEWTYWSVSGWCVDYVVPWKKIKSSINLLEK